MTQSTITVQIDTDDKLNFDTFCKNVGLSENVAINLFVKAVLRENKIPFEISSDPFFSKENLDYVKKSVDELRSGKGQAHEIIEAID